MKVYGLALGVALIASSPLMSATCKEKITFLSESIDDYKYLEHAQKELYNSNSRLVHDPYLRDQLDSPNSERTWHELIERLLSQGVIDRAFADRLRYSIICESLPTKYESPLMFLLLKSNFDHALSVKRKYFPNSKDVYYGTLPIGSIQAQALVPEGFENPMIIVNRDVFHFTGKFSKAISAAIPIHVEGDNIGLSYDEELIRKRVKENPWILDNFAQAMFSMVTRGSPAAAKEAALDADHNLLHARLVGGLDFFIIGHELGHVVLGHTGKRKLYAVRSGDEQTVDRSVDITLASYEGNQELAADGISLRLFVHSTMEASPDALLDAAIGAAGGDLFFGLIDLYDKYASMLSRPPMHGEAHPPAMLRSTNLDKVFMSEEMKSLGLHEMPDFRLLTRMAFKVLAEETEVMIKRAIEDYRQTQH